MSVRELKSSTPVSRGKVHCNGCGAVINKGVVYKRTTFVFDGAIYDWSSCPPCDEMTEDVAAWCSPLWGEGVSAEDFLEWAYEHSSDPRAVDFLKRHKETSL